MGKKGNWTHKHRVGGEIMISRVFKERDSITTIIQRTLNDTNDILRQRANLRKSQGQLVKNKEKRETSV